MTNPALWGPPVWQMLFACAWHCDASHFAELRELLLHQMPLLLPCEKCRHHFATHKPVVDRRAHGEPRTAEHAFKWLWYLKDTINKSLRPPRPSITMDDLTERHVLHGGVVDDVALGDALVLVAIEARALDRDDLFVSMCRTLSTLLPLPEDSQLRRALAVAGRPIVPVATRTARAARVERGLPELPASHYRILSDEGVDHAEAAGHPPPRGLRESKWL